jgi:hypothetical protein
MLVLACGDDTDTDNDIFITPRPHHLLYSNQGGYIIWVGVLFRASTKLMLIVSDPDVSSVDPRSLYITIPMHDIGYFAVAAAVIVGLDNQSIRIISRTCRDFLALDDGRCTRVLTPGCYPILSTTCLS